MLNRFKRQVLCPYCFEPINLSETPFLCENKNCEKKAKEENRIATFARARIPLLERLGITVSPDGLVHSDCGEISHKRLCPKCLEVLPRDIKNLTNFSIAIIGPKGAGKSHYIAMLIKKIETMAMDYNWSLIPVDDATINNYEIRYKQPLFKYKKPIRSTASEDDLTERRLSYTLHANNGKKVLIVFNDIAGEDFASTKVLNSKYKNYICNASGIICIMDPLQLRLVRDNIMTNHNENELPIPASVHAKDVISRIYNIIKEGSDKNISGKLHVPLAVAFSKMDFIKDAGETASTVWERLYQESRHQKNFSEDEFENINGILKSWLIDIDEMGIVSQTNAFESNGFFGFSAIGCNPQTVNANDPSLDREPRSCRVEDPFLWILKCNNIIKSK